MTGLSLSKEYGEHSLLGRKSLPENCRPLGVGLRSPGGSALHLRQSRAAAVLQADWPKSRGGVEQFVDLDRWLRLDGHRRNPGTSADLVTAGLFVALYEGWSEAPFAWSAD